MHAAARLRHLREEPLPPAPGVGRPHLHAGVTSGFGRLILRALKPPPEGYPLHPTSLGDHILCRRLDLNLMVMEVGARIGVNSKTVTTWEHGTAEPALALHPAIHTFLGYCPVSQVPLGLGARLMSWRRANGLSRDKLAARLKLNRTTLWMLERGLTETPTQQVLRKVQGLWG